MSPLYRWIISLLLCSHIYSAQAIASLSAEYVVVKAQPIPVGMFAILGSLAGYLFLYDEGCYRGVTVELDGGAYYDPAYGNNWWEYYFEPLAVGQRDHAPLKVTWGGEAVDTAMLLHCGISTQRVVFPYALTEFYLTRQRIHQLIQKYIQLKPPILHKLEHFVQANFNAPFIIGVHYRGTDKSLEAPRVTYREVFQAINKQIALYQLTNYKIFVATDERAFLRYMRTKFPHRVCFQPAERSTEGKPLHLTTTHARQQGEETIIDCLLLSRCHCLIRTSSNLSMWASFFNPHMPVISLSQRHAGYYYH